MSYYDSFYTNVEQDRLTLSGNHRPGTSNLEPSDSRYDYHPSIPNGEFASHFNQGNQYNANRGFSFNAAYLPDAMADTMSRPNHSGQAYPASRRDQKNFRRTGEVAMTEEEYRENGRPKNENFRHGPFSFKLPILPHKKAPVLHKQAALALTIKRFEGTEGKAFEKYKALNYRFTSICPEAELKVETIAAPLTDLSHEAYSFSNLLVLDETGSVIPAGYGPNFTNDFRMKATRFRFHLTFNPRKSDIPQELEIQADSLPKATTRTVYVEVPKQNNGKMVSEITYNMIRQRHQYKNLLKIYQEADVSFTLLATERSTDTPDSEPYDKWFRDTLASVKIATLKQAAKAYIGRLDGLKSLNDRLKEIKMKVYNRKAKGFTYLSVDELGQAFDVNLFEINPKEPPTDLIDLATAFYDALPHELRMALQDSIPKITSREYLPNLGRLATMKLLAAEEERKVKQIANITRAANGRQRQPRITHHQMPGTTTGTFMTNQDDELPPTPQHFPSPTGPPPNFHTPDHPFVHEFHTMVSQVETALQVASGTRYPRVCWGCGAAGHTYGKECPKHNDLAAAKAYNEEMQKFLERRRGNKRRHYGPSGTGFLTQPIHDAIQTIAADDTTPSMRETLLTQVAEQIHTFHSNQTESNKKRKTEKKTSQSQT